ncbi:hypothetical protein K2173_015674 [Erythroxylum novogranatense]|uniref:PWI domain-containing protein n=1 Tax=Erythroxylum novogranatense TaxID=1862640 RepID=A0AAV8SE79_9ROSI|nr:hypothetical protein K2173_015674 [Erythroxylum novogranatense]
MSGGFFRGTSADQDTRFSNKQAKLLKSQKFAPELDHLVDMGKVKMDVIRPWIANRVTELLGFEDEVLINFIYGLLDGKEVNGKEVQISLTGFMEKNTGKFMKELWSLLLSAQKNESGVPQQFLDAKAEETRKKQEELDRITKEIQKKKDKEIREHDQERSRKMDGEANNTTVEPASKHILQKDSSGYPDDEKEMNKKNGMRGRRISRSPYPANRSPSPRRGSTSRMSRSPSNSRSYSGKKSRSLSRSPRARSRSLSSDGVGTSSRKRSITPRRRRSPQASLSPPRRRSSYSRRSSRSLSYRGSPSPVRRRLHSPFRRRSPSPSSLRRRRSPSPVRRRRSPLPVRRRRSPSPARRRRSPAPIRRRRSPPPARRRRSPSPISRRSPSPIRRRSPSPVRRRSPPRPRLRSPSPLPRRYQRSPSSPRSLSPMRQRSPVPARRRSPPNSHHRSPSPYGSSSPSPVRSRSPVPPCKRSPAPSSRRSPPYGSRSSSPVQGRSPFPARRRSPVPSLHRSPPHYGSGFASPDHHRSPSPVRKSSKEKRRLSGNSHGESDRDQEKLSLSPRQHSRSLRSPNRRLKDGNSSRHKVADFSPSPLRSPILSESPPLVRKRSPGKDRSPYGSTAGKRRGQVNSDDQSSPPKLREHKPRRYSHDVSRKDVVVDRSRHNGDYKSSYAQKLSIDPSTGDKRKGSLVRACERDDYDFERLQGHFPTESHSLLDKVEPREKDKKIKRVENLKFDERSLSYSNTPKEVDHDKLESIPMLVEQINHGNGGGNCESGSASSDKHRTDNKEKRKHKKLHRREPASNDDFNNDSEIEEKQAKRRRKEEKRLQKEEKRRRREEKRRRKEKRHAEKMKMKGRYDSSFSDDEHGERKESCPSDNEEGQSEQKKLEIELRKKALESLKAKKGLSH